MGYTHYWDAENFTDEQWVTVQKFAEYLFKRVEGSIPLSSDDGEPPIINDKFIHINGVDSDSYEDFFVRKCVQGFNFCKTAQKPYDVVVVAMLQFMSLTNPNFSWRSDGDTAELAEGIGIVREYLEEIGMSSVIVPDEPIGVLEV